MNLTHLHLILNHVPIIGAIISLAAMIVAVLWKSEDYRRAALILAFVTGLLALPAYFSGEEAEESLEHQVKISEVFVEEHEEAARLAMIATVIAGAAAAVVFFYGRDKKPALAAVTVLFLVATGLMVRAGNTGGQIRHTEIRPASSEPLPAQPAEHEEEDE